MGRGLHKNWSHKEKRERYNDRKKASGYPKGGNNRAPANHAQ
jgi:hypothetical protein